MSFAEAGNWVNKQVSGLDRYLTYYSKHERLWDLDPLLHPDVLKQVYPEMKNYYPLFPNAPLLYGTEESWQRILHTSDCCKAYVFPFSGLTAGGKDTIRKLLMQDHPYDISKPVTATTRPPRLNEINGVDYFFYNSPQDFLNAERQGDFIETVPQYGNYYGLPKKSLFEAIETSNRPIILPVVEVSA